MNISGCTLWGEVKKTQGHKLRGLSPSEVLRITVILPHLGHSFRDVAQIFTHIGFRLHSSIKQGLPYPDEYRYGPGRPPPPNPHLRTASRASSQATLGMSVLFSSSSSGLVCRRF